MEDLPLLEFSYTSPEISKKLLAKKKLEDLGETLSQKLYSLFCINAYLSKKHEIRILDESEEDALYLFHYTLPGAEVNHIRGTVVRIFEGECSIVATSFPFAEDVMIEDVKEKDIILPFDKSSIVTEVLEGTTLRIYQGPSTKKWYVSTHKKLDGRKSRWSGNTFGEMLKEVWPDFEETVDEYLSPEFCYIFLLSHPENRLVCSIFPSLILLGKYCYPTLELGNLIKPHPSISLHAPVSREDYSIYTLDDLLEYVRHIPWQRSTGVLVYSPGVDGGKLFQHCFKLTHYEYMKRRILRGNEPNLKLRYLEFKMEAKEYLPEFLELFSDRKEIFEEVEKDVSSVISHIKKCYNRRYKNKEYCIFPQPEHILLENIKRRYNSSSTLHQNVEVGVWRWCTPRQLLSLIKLRKLEDA